MKKVRLGDVAAIERKGISPDEISDGTTYVGLENIMSGGRFVGVAPVSNGELASTKFKFEDEHILYGKLRPYLAKIAVPTFAGICSTDILPIRVGAHADRMYVTHYLRQQEVVDQVNSMATGANLPRISPKSLESVELPLPPLDEQRRIAAILDKADALRIKRRQALAHLDTLTQSIFHSMFGEPPTSWRETAIEDLVDKGDGSIRTGPFGSQLLTSEFTDKGVAVLGIDNAVSNEFAWRERRFISFEKYSALKRYTVKPGDLLVTIMGTLGRCAVVPADIPLAINTKHLCCITVDPAQVIPEWLHAYFLRSDSAAVYLRQTTKGAIMGGLNMGIIKKMPVKLPPLELQQTFAARVAAVERLKETHRKHLSELDMLFASLQHRAFKGEL
ncbi:restriction endonuclease subunit S [Arthrobacter sp. PM3]|uniref:restriction endonuclease subunit S n=1 Tax=Arthrobacter sp. PM3 TaxID=2017685 RepID=UPI000E10B47F|nr:restriction endonuclease subunit S [Arthrobacter sp. PM3]AXJ09361.1 restriction endonuclease [Arthrobacter sp. PM3]